MTDRVDQLLGRFAVLPRTCLGKIFQHVNIRKQAIRGDRTEGSMGELASKQVPKAPAPAFDEIAEYPLREAR